MNAGGGWAEHGGDEHASTPARPIAPPPPPPSNPAPVPAPGSTGATQAPHPGPVAPRPISQPTARPGPPRSGGQGTRTAVLALGGAVVLVAAVAGGWLLTRPDDSATVASDTTVSEARKTPAVSDTPSASAPATTEPAPVEASETPAATAPTVADYEDVAGDSSLSNAGALTSSSADVRSVHVHSPTQGAPGWVVVNLSSASPGVGVILRIDTDNDRWPDLTAWQHTATGASGSFRVADWSHGNDILQRSNETDEHFVAPGQQAPRTGVAFPLVFAPGELARQRLRFNVQTVNDDLYYDYFPSRQRWTTTAYEASR